MSTMTAVPYQDIVSEEDYLALITRVNATNSSDFIDLLNGTVSVGGSVNIEPSSLLRFFTKVDIDKARCEDEDEETRGQRTERTKR